MNKQIIDKQKETLARLLGIEASDISALSNTASRLMQKAVIVKLHVGRWRAHRALAMDDLGINETQESDLVNLGQKYLWPAEIVKRLQSIETAARNCIAVKCNDTEFGALCPVDAFPYLKVKLAEYKAQYMAVGAESVDQYNENKSSLLSAYREHAKQAYIRQQKLAGIGQTSKGLADYVERFVSRIEAMIPSKGEIESSFKFEVRLSYIPLPSMLRDGDDVAALVEAMVEQNGFQDGADDLLTSAAVQLRERIIETLENVIVSTEKQGKLHPRSAASLQNLIETVGRLNWANDTEISVMLNRINAVVETKQTDASGLADAFKDILTVARSTIIDLGSEPRQSRLSDMPDVQKVETVRQARTVLGLPDVAPIGSDRGKRSL